jgi:porin
MPTIETSGRRDDRRRLQLPKQGNQMLKARHMIHTAVQETRIGPQRPGALFGLRRRPDIRPRGWWASALAAVSILVLLVTTSAVRADGLSGNEASLGDRAQLTGNWGGSRDRLQEQGLSFTSRLSQFVQGMTAGDGEHNFRYGGKFDLGVRADLAALGFWDGLSLTAEFEYNFGNSVNGRGGTMVPVNTALAFPGIDGSDAFDLTSFYFAQSFGSSANLLIGKINMIDAAAGKPFAGGAGIDSFWNTTFAAPPSGLVPPYMLGAILTVATPAAKYNLWVYDPLDCVNRSCLDAPFSEGVTVRGSVDIPVTIGGLPGHQGFVALYSTYDGTDLDSLDGLLLPNPDPASLNIKSDRYYFAYTFDQYLYQSPSNPAEGIGLFGQFGISDGNPTRLYWSAQLGLGGVGLIPGRSNDNWGVAYYYDALSGALKDSVGTVTTLNDEQGLEIFYNFTVTPWLTIGADLQIIDPALADETAVFFGIRTVVEF